MDGDVLDRVARESGFSGAIRVDEGNATTFARAYGLADRARGVLCSPDLRYAIASGTKGFTALTIVSLIEDGILRWDTPARALLGRDLPLVDERVSVEHLLAHRSGIGDYLDEDEGKDVTDYALGVDPASLDSTERYLAVLDGKPAKFLPGERFSYCNSGYVVLALIAERATGSDFYELVGSRVCARAGLRDTSFPRLDALPADAARGYLAADDDTTNERSLPVLGSGDGGMYSTVDDVHRLWRALFAGSIVSRENAERMARPLSEPLPMRYGLGFWIDPNDAVVLEGHDAGISFRSVCCRSARVTYTVIANTSEGAWPVARALRDASTDDLR